MRRSEHICPRYQAAVEVIGRRWVGLIVKLLIERPLRYSELLEQLDVCGDRMLAGRLKELENEGIIERRVYPETPVRVEYRLTQKGQALEQVIAAIGLWAEEWIDCDQQPSVVVDACR
ncbi:MAG: helix-turn-helix domain-containing protein [Herpetosiphon sp.]